MHPDPIRFHGNEEIITMAMPRVSDCLPFYDPTKSSLAYGSRALPKLNGELQSSDLRVRQQALLLLADVLHKRENLASALREGIPSSLKNLLADGDQLVRERAAKVLCNIAQHSLGRQDFLRHDIITALSMLFSDSSFEVRVNAHSAVEMCARNTEGAKGTVAAGLVPLCVKKLVEEEKPQLKEIIMDTLHWCFIVDNTDGLACDVITICQSLLGHEQSHLQGQAARIIFDLTVPLDGKKIACSVEGCIAQLVRLLNSQCDFVKAQALAALMSIAVITAGKQGILDTELIPTLVDLLDNQNSEIRLNSIKLLGLLAEAPKGKEIIASALYKLQEMSVQDENDMVKKTAHIATKIVRWLP